jgi:hypothetical protein
MRDSLVFSVLARRHLSLLTFTALLVFYASGVCAQAQITPARIANPSWAMLSPSEQTALQPLQDDWDDINPGQKRKWIDVAEKFSTMPATDQARIQGRMAQWAQLNPAQRSQTRLGYKEAQQLSPTERNERWQAYQALSAEQREQLAAKTQGTGPQIMGATTPGAQMLNYRAATQPPKIVVDEQLVDKKTLLPKANNTLVNSRAANTDLPGTRPTSTARP